MKKFLLIPVLLLGQVGPPVPINETDVMGWDHSGLDVQGNPEAVVSSEMGLFKPGTIIPIKTVTGTVPPNLLTVGVLAQDLPGGVFDLRVRVFDAAGNGSAWGEPFPGSFPDTVPPEAVTNFGKR